MEDRDATEWVPSVPKVQYMKRTTQLICCRVSFNENFTYRRRPGATIRTYPSYKFFHSFGLSVSFCGTRVEWTGSPRWTPGHELQVGYGSGSKSKAPSAPNTHPHTPCRRHHTLCTVDLGLKCRLPALVFPFSTLPLHRMVNSSCCFKAGGLDYF